MSRKNAKKARQHMRDESTNIINNLIIDIKNDHWVIRLSIAINIFFAVKRNIELMETPKKNQTPGTKKPRRHMKKESIKIINIFIYNIKKDPLIERFLIAINILFAMDKNIKIEKKPKKP